MGVVALALLGSGDAHAQGIDASGSALPPVDASPRTPLTLQSTRTSAAGSWSVGGLLEIVDEPLVRYELVAPDTVERRAVVDDLLGVALGGRYAVSDRFTVGASVPVWLGSGGELVGGWALGDLHVWAPLSIVAPDASGAGFGLAAVPYVDLPTGAAGRNLGDRHTRLGLTGAASLWGARAGLSANLGVETGGRVPFANQEVGGTLARIGLSAGVLTGRRVGLHLEARSGIPLHGRASAEAPDASTTGAPTEVLLTFKGQTRGRRWYAGGMGRGASQGIGSSNFRMLLGMGWGRELGPETSDPLDVAPVTVRVVDRDGAPVHGAVVFVGAKQVAQSDHDGVLTLEDPRWRRGVELRAPGYVPATLEPEGPLVDGVVTLQYEPRPVTLSVRDERGQPVDAGLTARSLDDPDAEPVLGSSGPEAPPLPLLPGRWRVEVEADGLASQARELVVSRSTRAPAPTEIVLLPVEGDAQLVHRIVDPDGTPVGGARILLDGRPVGTSGEGGVVELSGVAVGRHGLLVQHRDFNPADEPAVTLGPGENLVKTVLKRVPGSVKVVVHNADGRPVPDAVVRFDGPSRLAPMSLGDGGERITALGPGRWTLLVTSAAYGLQQRSVVVPPDSYELLVVEVVLQPSEHGDAELAVRVVDPEGHPVDGAEVLLDGRSHGRTSTGGALDLSGLAVGARELQLAHERFREQASAPLLLVEGLQERVVTLEWRPGSTQVLTRAPTGPVEDAIVRFVGPEQLPPSPLGPGGEGLFELDSGSWQVVVTSEEHGLQTRRLLVPPDSRVLHVVDVVMNPDEGGLSDLALRVANPEGHGVAGAEVLLDGTSLGRTTNTGGLTSSHLSLGHRMLEVRAPLYQPMSRRVRLLEGEQEHEVVLDWAPGAVRIRAQGPEGPVTDAIARFLGPQPVPPAPLDTYGEQLFALSPGRWQALVVSESHGIAQQSVEITDDDELIELSVSMSPVAAGTADVLFRVQDADGRPIPGVSVALDRHDLGLTGDGGALLVQGLAPGPVAVGLSAESYAPYRPARIQLTEGSQERIFRLDFLPGTVTVRVTDPQGRPVDAELSLVGPVDLPTVRTGPGGLSPLELRPGTWQIIAATETLGPERAEVVVEPGREAQSVELALEPSRVRLHAQAVEITETVPFDFDKATLRPDGAGILDQVANTLLSHPGIVRVEVQGHTDAVGRVAYNQELSQRRAEAVVAALIARGVPSQALTARGYGNQRPIAPDTEEGRAANRRVEFLIVEQAGGGSR